MHGVSLLPPSLLPDGLHPSHQGNLELARNLQAQLGFAPVKFSVVSCSPLTVAVAGIRPRGGFDFYFGSATDEAKVRARAGEGCVEGGGCGGGEGVTGAMGAAGVGAVRVG